MRRIASGEAIVRFCSGHGMSITPLAGRRENLRECKLSGNDDFVCDSISGLGVTVSQIVMSSEVI